MYVFEHIALVILCFLPMETTSRLLKSRYKRDMEAFVVGGAFAKIEEFPHAAFLAIACTKKRQVINFSCGSSIINQRLLLTAAHCFEDCTQRSHVLVGVGSEKKHGNLIHEVSHFIMHPKYDTVKVTNDVALASVTKDIQFNQKVKRVVLMENPPMKEVLTLAGWGITDEDLNIDGIFLKYAEQVLLSKERCTKVLEVVNSGTICVSGLPERSNFGYAAAGDSGSAILARRYIQIGLVSFKIPKFSKSVVGITDISYYYNWIKTNAKELFCRSRNKKY